LQKISENEIQTHFQERFFEKKILHKLEEYINYYREISKQMNFTIESGKLPEDIPLNNEADD
jgi:2-phosphoglycerate kinase